MGHSASLIRKPGSHLLVFLMLIALTCGAAFGQTANYGFSSSNGAFTEISGGTVPTFVDGIDDGYSNNLPLGFTFKYWNTDYTSFNVSTNGWISFGAEIIDALYNNDLTSGTIRPVIAPMWDDLTMTNTTSFSYFTTPGTSDRVFTAQWLNMKWDAFADDAVISFQVKLYEASGKIEFIYRQETGMISNTSGGASIGLAGPLAGSFVSVSAINPAAASSSSETTSISTRPASNQVFTFLPCEIVVSSPSQIPAGNIGLGATNVILSTFQVTSTNAYAILNSLSFTTAGTCTGSDLLNLKLYHSSQNSFPGGTPVSTVTTYSGAGNYSFSGFARAITGTGYFWITGDVSSTATIGNTIKINANPVLTFLVGIATGSISEGGLQTVTGPAIQISSPNPAVPSGTIVQDTKDNIIYRLDNIVTQSSATMTGLTITLSGSFTGTDLSYLRVWFSTDHGLGSDLNVGKKAGPIAPGTYTFKFSPYAVIPANTTGYIFVTADIPCTAVTSHTIQVSAVTTSNVSFQSGTKSGSTSDGGTKTIADLLPSNVSSPSASVENVTSVLSWTNPVVCFDEIMIVAKANTSVSGIPSGTSYTANLAFGTPGSEFGENNGFVVYKGITSPQTVTALTPGTNYYYKFFTRKGNNWSLGVEVSATTQPPLSGEFRSLASGNWDATSTWEYYNNGWGGAPSIPTNSSGKITIRNGHTVTVTYTSESLTVDQLTVDAGGILSTGTKTLTIGNGDATDCTVNGTILNSGAIELVTGATLLFNDGSTYNHTANGGVVPSATWNTGSTCLFTGSNTLAPSGLNQTFSNFTWNCPGQTSQIILAGPTSVNGTFRLISTGTGSISNSINSTYSNYVQTGGTYSILGGGTTLRSLTVTNFTMQDGTFNMSDGSSIGTLNVSGNFTHSAGLITETMGGSGHIVFNGTYSQGAGMQTYASGGNINNTISITVNPNAYLQMASEETIITGGGGFTLSAGGRLGITSSNGIARTGLTSGNIQTTGTRSFNPGAHYIYNRSGAQVTGTGLPYGGPVITGSITIAASSVTTSTNTIIANAPITVDGILIPGPDHLIGGTGTLNGTGIVKVTRTAGNADFLSQYTITNKNLTNLMVDYAAPGGGQVISPFTFVNLKLSNTSGTNTLNGTTTVNSLTTSAGGTLVIGSTGFLTATNLTNNGIVTIESSGKGTIDNIVNNSILNLTSGGIRVDTAITASGSLITDSYTGNGPNMELYTPYTYHYIASPFSNLTASVITGNPNTAAAVMEYRESLVTDNMNSGWVTSSGHRYDPIANTWTPNYPTWNNMNKGYGYYYFSRDPYRYTLTGPINTSDQSVYLSYSGAADNSANHGYNMLGNPFTSSIDWDDVLTANASIFPENVGEAIYFRLNGLPITYVGGITTPDTYNSDGSIIPPMQGFFIKQNIKTASPLRLIIPESSRVHAANKRYKGAGSIPLIRLQYSNSDNTDQIVVRFDEKATMAFDNSFDAYKIYPSADVPAMSSVLNGIEYSINGLPFPESSISIPLTINVPGTGSYTINVKEILELDNYKVILADNLLGTNTSLRDVQDYTFSSASGKIQDRFVLKVMTLMTDVPENKITKNAFNVFHRDNMINIQTIGDEWDGKKGSVKIFDINGKIINTRENIYIEKGDITQIPFNSQRGVYFVEIKSGIQRFVGKVLVN